MQLTPEALSYKTKYPPRHKQEEAYWELSFEFYVLWGPSKTEQTPPFFLFVSLSFK